MTLKQARYQARRAAIAEFTRHMSCGRAGRRFDSAEYSARLAYDSKLSEHGFNPIDDRVDFRFSQSGKFIEEEG